jgi:hypothetical protein
MKLVDLFSFQELNLMLEIEGLFLHDNIYLF